MHVQQIADSLYGNGDYILYFILLHLIHIHEIMESMYWLVTLTMIPNKIAYRTYKPCDSFPYVSSDQISLGPSPSIQDP